jgi:hypothetical protein
MKISLDRERDWLIDWLIPFILTLLWYCFSWIVTLRRMRCDYDREWWILKNLEGCGLCPLESSMPLYT